jgi:hypothetical protein
LVINSLQLQGLLKFQEEAGFVPPKKQNGYGEHIFVALWKKHLES